MKTLDYLTWFKDLDARLHGRRGHHSLMTSNVHEPLDTLIGHLDEHRAELRKLQSYNNDWGHPVLLERMAARYGVRPVNILLTNGCTNATYLAVLAHVKRGHHVVCETPAYQPIWQTARSLGARISWLHRRPPSYEINLDELSGLINRNTSLLILTNLHNPSGARLEQGQLRQIAITVRNKNPTCRILVDEVFRDFEPGQPAPACTVDRSFISTGSLSKVYGLSHLECGWIMADPATIMRATPFFVMAEGNGSRYLESLSAVVFAHIDEYLAHSLNVVETNRRLVEKAVQPLIAEGFLEGAIPEQGCIYFPRIAVCRDTAKLCENMARKYSVYAVPGHFFGEPAHIRLGFGTRTNALRPAIARFSEAVRACATRRRT